MRVTGTYDRPANRVQHTVVVATLDDDESGAELANECRDSIRSCPPVDDVFTLVVL
jgi:hypothetical protein